MGLFIGGTDIQGFLRAAWSIPFRTGLMVPDYMIVGPEFGDPSSGWTAGDGSPHLGAGTKGAVINIYIPCEDIIYREGYWRQGIGIILGSLMIVVVILNNDFFF